MTIIMIFIFKLNLIFTGKHMNKNNEITQVKDDLKLLEQMIQDSLSADSLYTASNYWLFYEKKIIEELRTENLKDFRRKENSELADFGAVDSHWIFAPIDNSLKGLYLKFTLFNFKIVARIKTIKQTGIRDFFSKKSNYLNLYLYELAKSYGKKCGARPIEQFEADLVGNPHVFTVNEKQYTTNLLYYYVMYSYCCQFIDFDKINSIMEIGGGSGKQIEVIKKFHPHLTFYVLDLCPQLYVCERYLTEVFPNSVVSYKETRDMTRIPDNKEGKIFILGNWKISTLENLECDGFWNSASLQEMEPDIVANYLKYVNSQTTQFVFLHETMGGQTLAKEEGKLGVLKKTTLEDYKRSLSNFVLHDSSIANHLPTLSKYTPYRFTFWKRKKITNGN